MTGTGQDDPDWAAFEQLLREGEAGIDVSAELHALHDRRHAEGVTFEEMRSAFGESAPAAPVEFVGVGLADPDAPGAREQHLQEQAARAQVDPLTGSAVIHRGDGSAEILWGP